MDFKRTNEVDIAVYVLNENGVPMFYKDLIKKVIELKEKPVQSWGEAISEVYTLINMDSRFSFVGDGNWGLTEWNPPEVKRRNSHSRSNSAANRASKEKQRKDELLKSIQE